jgi:hypothetical protein
MNDSDGSLSLDCWHELNPPDDADPDGIWFSNPTETLEMMFQNGLELANGAPFSRVDLWEKLDDAEPRGTWRLICTMVPPGDRRLWPDPIPEHMDA